MAHADQFTDQIPELLLATEAVELATSMIYNLKNC
jgi:hypothetical protein